MAENRFINGCIIAALWLLAFAAPVLFSVVLAAILYYVTGSEILVIILFISGGLAGIMLAEYIRRTHGLVEYFGKVYGPASRNDRAKRDQ